MRTSGLGFSLLLIATGAVLAWAVEVDAEGVNLNTVGLILFAVGIVGALATMVLTGVDRTTVIERDRNHVVERET